jgi:hypothetical protein
MEDLIRFKAFCFPHVEESVICVYDFQTQNCRVYRPELGEPIKDYSVIFLSPLIYVVGGVDSTGIVTRKTWQTSPGDESLLRFGSTGDLVTGRRKGCLLSLQLGVMYAVLGFDSLEKSSTCIKDCERYEHDKWTPINPLHYDQKYVVGVLNCMYAFGDFKSELYFERLWCDSDDLDWETHRLVLPSSFDSPTLESLSHFALIPDPAVPDKLLLFGGSRRGLKSRDVFAFQPSSGKLALEQSKLEVPAEFNEGYTTGPAHSYHITTDLKLCLFSKQRHEWRFVEPDGLRAVLHLKSVPN